ncbi:MAG: VPLPA-CTERM sorting domain-containing protein [Candidatus Methylumidiphilus sp.]
MSNTKLNKAIALAVAGLALSAGGISSAFATVNTMYNLSTGNSGPAGTTDPTAGGVWSSAYTGATDGWTNGADPNFTSTVGDIAPQQWAGTTGATTAAFGYNGAHMNWGFEITGGSGGTGTISTFDSFARYGIYADIDTAKGAWSDAAIGGASGWRHDLDVGLFRTDTSGQVTLSATGILQTGTNFGFTIFSGADATTGYNHHGAWNANNNAAGITSASNPIPAAVALAGSPLSIANIVAYSVGGATPSNLNTISFNATAGQTYQIFLGGYRNGAWGATTDGYALTISQTPVPVPAAVWLFGSALAGLGVFGRRKPR